MPSPTNETRLLPTQLREARFLPDSFNAEARTIEVVWTTGARARRYNWWREEYYDEELEVSESAVDMSRLNSGACAVLNGHRSWGLEGQIGVVERAWIKDGQGHAVLRLSQRDEVAGIVTDIANGIIRNVSVGYSVQTYQITREEGQVPVYRAIAWTPHEISFVAIPADAASMSRSAEPSQGAPCLFVRAPAPEVETVEEPNMPQHTAANERAADSAVPATPAAAPAAASAAAPAAADTTAADSASRAADIVDLATRHGFADRSAEWIRAGHDLEKVRALILDEMERRDAGAGGHLNRVAAGEDEIDKRRAAAENMLLARGQVRDPATSQIIRLDPANPMRGFTLLELARASLERAGVRTAGMDKRELVGRAFTQHSSDFPVVLENAMHKALQNSYALAPSTWQRFCRTGSVSDFRAHNRYRLGSIGNLDSLTELNEFKSKAIPDGEKASIKAGTKGNIINLSRQAIIDDDIGAFVGMAEMLGRVAQRTIEVDAHAYLASNPVMPDGKALFHADHFNLESAGAPSVATIGAASDKMAAQKGLGGDDILDLSPAIFLGNKAYARLADVAVNSTFDPDANNKLQRKNAVHNEVRDIVSTARVTDSKWYLFADPNEAPVIEVAFLDGLSDPFLDLEEGFTVDGARWKVRLDFGIAAIDYRGAVRNG